MLIYGYGGLVVSRCLPLLFLLVLLLLSACAQQAIEPVANEYPVAGLPAVPHPPRCGSIAAVGDIMLGESAQPYLTGDYVKAFSDTQPWLSETDITIGNLETALTVTENQWIEKKYRFRNEPAVASALRTAGFDIVSLANNHTMDYGPQGLLDTLHALEQAGVVAHGAGENLPAARKPALIGLSNGLKVGFLAYSNTFPKEFWATINTAGTAFGHQQQIVEDISLLKNNTDFIVVSFHWGREKQQALREYQALLAHAAVGAGADVILGHHPHILQKIERYQEGLIFYSLGNFSFGSFSPSAKTSVLAQINLCEDVPPTFKLLPLNVNNFQVYFQPQPLSGDGATEVLNELQSMLLPDELKLKLDNDWIVEDKHEAP